MTPSSSRTRATSRRSSSTSTHTPAERGNTTWSPGLTGILKSGMSGGPSPTARTMPSFGGRSCVPCGTSRPDLRMRSGSSSLITTWSKSGRRASGIRALHALEVFDRVGSAKPLGRLAAAVAHAVLPGVELDDDLRIAGVAESEEADRPLGLVDDLMCALFARREDDDLTLFQVPPTLRGAQRRTPFEHHDDLLFVEMRVVRVGGFAWVDLPIRQACFHRTGLVTQLRASCAEAGLGVRVVEVRAVDVRHGADPTSAGASLGCMSTDAADIDVGSLRAQLKLLADYL